MKDSRAAFYSTASILVVLLAISLLSNQYAHSQNKGGNKSLLSESANVDLNQTVDKILHRGIAVSEEFTHPYLNNTHRVIILPFREDFRTYTGILNFRASTPVEVILGQRIPIDNTNLLKVK